MFDNLIIDVIKSILQKWLWVKELCRFDSACCNKKYRDELYLLYGDNTFVFGNTFFNKSYKWLQLKKIKFNTLRDVVVSPKNYGEIKYTLSQIKYAYVHTCKVSITSFIKIIDELYSIESLCLAKSCRSIRMCDDHCEIPDIDIDTKIIEIITKLNYLRLICLDGVNVTNVCINKIAENCTLLKSFSIKSLHNSIDDECIIKIGEKCKLLNSLKIDCGENLITNDGILKMLQKCKSLRAFKIICGKHSNITDDSIGNILNNCGSIRKLAIDCQYNLSVTNKSIINVAKHGKSLKTLSIFCNFKITDTGIQAISLCRKLQQFVVYASNITDESIREIAKKCKLLKYYCGIYHNYTLVTMRNFDDIVKYRNNVLNL